MTSFGPVPPLFLGGERLAGQQERVGQRVDTFGGADVEEQAYAWRDLAAPLVRRKLATEE